MIRIKRAFENLFTVSEKKFLLTVFILSVLIRIIFGVYYFVKYGSSNFDDDWAYIKFAQKMIERGIFFTDISGMSPTVTGLGPAFPGLIMITFLIFGYNFLPMIIVNVIMSALLTIVIYHLGKITFSREVGILASLWSLFYIGFIRYVPTLLKENYLQLMFPLFVLFLLLEISSKHKIRYLVLSCITYTLLIHADERYFIYLLPAAFIILFDKDGLKLSYKRAFLFIIMIIVAMIPWLIRNYYIYERPVILTERTALYTDRLFGYETKNIYSQQIQISPETLDSILNGQQVYDVTLYNLIQRGLSFGILPRKYSTAEKLYVDFKEFWRPFRFSNMWVSEGFRPEGKWSLFHNLSEILTYGILLPFFIIAIFQCLKKKNKFAVIILIFILIHTVMHITFVLSQYRYRIQMDAFIIVFAFYGIYELIIKNILQKREII